MWHTAHGTGDPITQTLISGDMVLRAVFAWCAGLKEDETNPDQDLVENEALQSSSHGLKNTAIWRLLDGPGATPEVAARTPVANRTAAGRLDFVLQVKLFLSALGKCYGHSSELPAFYKRWMSSKC